MCGCCFAVQGKSDELKSALDHKIPNWQNTAQQDLDYPLGGCKGKPESENFDFAGKMTLQALQQSIRVHEA
jgi:hypothetical protein